jgi:GNAT superfamily N-acetyltransferase
MANGSDEPQRSNSASRVRPPEPLSGQHDLSANGKHASLDEWLRHRALTSEGLSARTYVVCDAAEPVRVVGYYAISTAMEQRVALPTARLRRAMHDHVPFVLIGRLAVDHRFQGFDLGSELLSDALRRYLAATEIVGARGIIAHAIDDDAVRFYQRHGFMVSPLGERVVLLPIETVRALFEG